MLGQKLQENLQFKIDKILTDFVIDYSKDDNEERIDSLHNQTVEKYLCLFEEIFEEMLDGRIK